MVFGENSMRFDGWMDGWMRGESDFIPSLVSCKDTSLNSTYISCNKNNKYSHECTMTILSLICFFSSCKT